MQYSNRKCCWQLPILETTYLYYLNYYQLPILADSNGLVIVKFKRKVQYNGDVILFLKSLLLYMKENKFLYNDIQVNLENILEAWLLSDIDNPVEM